MARVTDPRQRGDLISVTGQGGAIDYTQRPDGQPASITTGGVVTTFGYDNYGRQTSIIDPSAGTKSYYYDAAGNINREIDANNKEIKTTYDTYNRVTRKEIVGELTTDCVYNTDGLVSTITGSNGTSKSYGYDGLMRLNTETENVPDGKFLTKTYTYANGTVTDIAYSSNNGAIATENYLYSNGFLAETKLNNATSTWKLTQENDMGLAVAASTGNLTRTYGYDAYGLPTARTIKNGATVLQDFGYHIDPVTGNLNWRKDGTRNIQENFAYDNLNRLTTLRGISIAYDTKGNITDYPGVGSFGYKRADKPYAVTSVTPYGTAIPLREQTINYNGMQRPTLIAENGYVATLAYNPDGDRVKMQITLNGADYLTRYYIGGQYETEAGIAGTKEKLYLSGGAYSAAAVLIKENGGAWNVNYLGRDYQGNITHLIDASGAMVQELSYDPWGRLRNPANQELYAVGTEPTPLLGRGYTGHEHLTMFGLINMNARLYDPAVGRFLSPDPYVQDPTDSQNYNRYTYCLNNPLKYTDPTGLYSSREDAMEEAKRRGGSSRDVHLAKDGRWYVSLDEDRLHIYSSGGTLTRYFGLDDAINLGGGSGGSSKGGIGTLAITNFTVGATGTFAGAMEAGWKLSSNASQWSSANTIARSLKDTGIKVGASAIKNGMANGLKATGKFLGVVGVGFTAYDALKDGNLTLGEGAKIGIGLVTTFTPVGWVYGVADIGFQVVSGTSLTDRAGNFIDNY